MSPISLIKLIQTKLAAIEFRTKSDANIQADILRTIPSEQQIIITTDKIIESKQLSAALMVENKTNQLMFDVVEELRAGQQYILRLTHASVEEEECLNVCGAAMVKFSIPSFHFNSGASVSRSPQIIKEVILIGTDYLVIEDHSGVATNNAQDCLEAGEPVTLFVQEKEHDVKIASVKKLSSRMTKITLENAPSVAVLATALEPEIAHAVKQEVINHKTLIEEIYHEIG